MARLDKIENRIAGYLSDAEIAGAQKVEKAVAAASKSTRKRAAKPQPGPPSGPGDPLALPAGPDSVVAKVHIRWMLHKNMPEILAIENEAFSEYPWSEEDYVRVLRQRNCIGMVALDGGPDGPVVGYVIYELHRNRLHILNFAVAPKFRKKNVGRQMLLKLVSKLSPARRNKIMLEVRETNLGALNFFKACGFRAVSVIRDFYEDATEDAFLMEFRYVAEPMADDAEEDR